MCTILFILAAVFQCARRPGPSRPARERGREGKTAAPTARRRARATGPIAMTRKDRARIDDRGPAPEHRRPGPGGDDPRPTWVGWLHRQADDYDRRGPAGRLVAAELRKLAITAEALGATGPAEHERLLEA